jgi:DNA ligase (NAD+)
MGGKPTQIPKRCPVCSGRVVRERQEDVAYRCINPFCPAQLERGILHFACRAAMDIQGMGESVVSQLVKLKLVTNFADIYKLKAEDLLKLELFKDKKVNNLLSAIEKSKAQPLSRLIYALGIRHVGEKAAYVLAEEFKTMENLMRARKEDFDAIAEVGPVMAAAIADYFSNPLTQNIILELKKSGLNFKQESVQIQAGYLNGKNVVFTGDLKSYTRSKAKELLRQHGGNPSSSVTKNTDLIVVGENPGSKYNKAKAKGIKIIHEQEFSRLIGSA